jgi:formylglycine-generating enzyme required for sulfatase activity
LRWEPGAEQVATASQYGIPVTFTNQLGMRFVLIPQGEFRMGSPATEPGRSHKETQISATITRPYYMLATEVTNAQYRLFMPDHHSGEFMGHGLDAWDQPASGITWGQAVAYCEWLEVQDPTRRYCLPTEAQWERACRAGTCGAFSWSESGGAVEESANVCDDVTNKLFGFEIRGCTPDDGHRVAAPVGSYAPNPWGLFDMHGNVWEWCADWYGFYWDPVVVDPTGPRAEVALPRSVTVFDPDTLRQVPSGRARVRVLRGGSWGAGASEARSGARDYRVPSDKCPAVGFRVISPLPDS